MTAVKKAAAKPASVSKMAKPAVKATATPAAPVDPARAELLKCRDRYFKVLQRTLKAVKGEGDAAHHAAGAFLVRYSELYCQASEALFMENYRGTLAKLRRKEEAVGDALSPGRVVGEPADEVEEVIARAVRKFAPAEAPKPAAKKAVKAAVKKPAAKKKAS